MHILEQYSLSCGLKIDKPYIFEKYFPIPFEKYIVVDTSSEFENQKYNYWAEVINFISPILQKENIKIVHFLNENEAFFKDSFSINSNILTTNHRAFIIKNSLMYIGTNNFNIQLASSYDKKIVGIYSNIFPSHIGPFWSKPENIKLLLPDYKNKKPSYFMGENPKIINTIKPEIISKAILDLFNINHDYYNRTLLIGDRYGSLILEAYPDQIIPPNVFPNHMLNVRIDYKNDITDSDYISILNNLQIRPCTLVVDKKINLKPFLQFKERVTHIFYDVTNAVDIEFINEINSYGFKLILIFNKNNENEDIINQRKLEVIDFIQNIEVINKNNKLDLSINNKTFFKSSKIIFKDNKIFNSKAAALQNLSLENLNEISEVNLSELINLNIFIEEDFEYSYIFEKS